MTAREAMEFDVIIVGGGPAGLAAACRLRQLAEAENRDLSVCLLEKGAEIGAHSLSGAIIDPRAMDELFPDWRERGAPMGTAVTHDDMHLLTGAASQLKLPRFLLPSGLHNQGNHVGSLGQLCRWLANEAEAMGVEVLAGFAAAEVLYDTEGRVCGVATGEMGRARDGSEKPGFEAGYELRAPFTLFAEGCRGHLGKELIRRYALDKDSTPQHYGLGIKEIWEVPENLHEEGKVLHSLGWPLGFGKESTGGAFLYHLEKQQVAVGLITDLNYSNPWLSPFQEFQRLKTHPLFSQILKSGRRLSWGARALSKGGLQSLPRMVFPGGLLIGDDAGVLNVLKLKGTHTAMKSGMLAADALMAACLKSGSLNEAPARLEHYESLFADSWLHEELERSRNCAPALHKFGTLAGAAFCFIDQRLFRGRLPFTLKDSIADHETLKPAHSVEQIVYSKPDNQLTFDRLSSVYLSNTNHEEDQPVHLTLLDPELPIRDNLPRYAEPAQRYCPAGVYEVVQEEGEERFHINAQNCIHCKTCDIKDPAQNIHWVSPEGGGGPLYSNM